MVFSRFLPVSVFSCGLFLSKKCAPRTGRKHRSGRGWPVWPGRSIWCQTGAGRGHREPGNVPPALGAQLGRMGAHGRHGLGMPAWVGHVDLVVGHQARTGTGGHLDLVSGHQARPRQHGWATSIWWWAIGHGHARTGGHLDLVSGHQVRTGTGGHRDLVAAHQARPRQHGWPRRSGGGSPGTHRHGRPP